ncbi:MAG: DUF4232 domain-containing protein [Chloroflexota bacterium]
MRRPGVESGSGIRRRRRVIRIVAPFATLGVAAGAITAGIGATSQRQPSVAIGVGQGATSTLLKRRTAPFVPGPEAPVASKSGLPLSEPTSAPVTYTTRALPCASENLSVSEGAGVGASGVVSYPIIFANRSLASCLLKGQATVVASGQGVPDVHSSPGGTIPVGPPGDMAQGEESSFELGTYSYCASFPNGGGDTYSSLLIRLPSGGTTTLALPDPIDAACGVRVSTFAYGS